MHGSSDKVPNLDGATGQVRMMVGLQTNNANSCFAGKFYNFEGKETIKLYIVILCYQKNLYISYSSSSRGEKERERERESKKVTTEMHKDPHAEHHTIIFFSPSPKKSSIAATLVTTPNINMAPHATVDKVKDVFLQTMTDNYGFSTMSV